MEQHFELLGKNDEAMHEQLSLLQANLQAGKYPGYPEFHDRLFAHISDLHTTPDNRLIIPEGSWTVDAHPNQHMVEHVPDESTQEALQKQGLLLDSLGRPLHPWFNVMASDPSIGVVFGKGAYWHWGPNYTADNIVLCQDHVLLVKRKDNGMWALPGGHVDLGETDSTASLRELTEETGLILPETITGSITYRGPVVDPRVTANAWPETTAVRYILNQPLPEVTGQDDAEKAAWFPLEVVANGEVLFGSHRYLLRTALEAA